MAAIELGCPFWIYNPAQTDYLAFNQPSDSKFVGYIDDITGLDDHEIRENAQNINAGDGGLNGRFYRGRRPWTMLGWAIPTNPVSARSAVMHRIEDILDQCLTQDGWLMWTPSDTVTKYITFRKQQPLRDTVGNSKTQRKFFIAGVAADWRVLSLTLHSVTTLATAGAGVWTALPTVHNAGTAKAPWTFTLTGPSNQVQISNDTTGMLVSVTTNLTTGQTLTIDTTGRYPTVNVGGVDHYGDVVVPATNWSVGVEKGDNTWRFWTNGATAATRGTFTWRDAWP